jgi:hypothetical protein
MELAKRNVADAAEAMQRMNDGFRACAFALPG